MGRVDNIKERPLMDFKRYGRETERDRSEEKEEE